MKTVSKVIICRETKKDEFLEANYARAKQAAEIVSKLTESRKQMEEQVETASGWRSMLRLLQELLVCLEVCLDSPFESMCNVFTLDWLLNVVEYVELMEQSSLESELEETIQLFTAYMKLPIKEVKVRIIKKMVICRPLIL